MTQREAIRTLMLFVFISAVYAFGYAVGFTAPH